MSSVIKVCARSYAVEFWSEQQIAQETGHNDICGFTDHYRSKVILNGNLAHDAKKEALMHEILHILLTNSGIDEISRQTREGANLSELVATILAPRFHALLEENDLVKLLASV